MNPDELRHHIENLPEEDDEQLYVWSLRCSSGNLANAEDLYFDTLAALLDATFTWKEGVPFRAHAYWVMRRLSSARRRKRKREVLGEAPSTKVEDVGADAETKLSVADADRVADAVRNRLPAGFTRDLWDLMYVAQAETIEEQLERLGLGPEQRTRIDTARKLIKRVAKEVFEEVGLIYSEPRHQGRRHAAK
jgi:DNA-directed RNA polymerase specialized sigma24 family protein